MLRAPLPTTLNYNLAIHSNDPFWIVQKDQASLSAVRLTTPRRPVQTGRLRSSAARPLLSRERKTESLAPRPFFWCSDFLPRPLCGRSFSHPHPKLTNKSSLSL